jgi:hypothetical protein
VHELGEQHAAALQNLKDAGWVPGGLEVTRAVKLSRRIAERPVIDACSDDELVARVVLAKSGSAGNQFIAAGAALMNGRVSLRGQFEKLLIVARKAKAGQEVKKVERQQRRDDLVALKTAALTSTETFDFDVLTNAQMKTALLGLGASGVSTLGKPALKVMWAEEFKFGTREAPEVYPPIALMDGFTLDEADDLQKRLERATAVQPRVQAAAALAEMTPNRRRLFLAGGCTLRLINRSPEQHAIDAANPGYVSHTSDTFAAMYVDGVNQFG